MCNLLEDSNCSIIILNFLLNILSLILFLICFVTIYKYLNNIDNTYRFSQMGFFYSSYITFGIFSTSSEIIANFPMAASLFSIYYPGSLSDNYPDIGYTTITDDLGIFLFNHYLYQHLENEPISFLSNLVSLDLDKLIPTFANNHNMLKECLLEYNNQKDEAIRDSHNTLVSIVSSVIERANLELNIDLLERHTQDGWLDVYIKNLECNPVVIDGSKYLIFYDNQLNISYLANESDYYTFKYALEQMNKADFLMDMWARDRSLYFNAIVKGIMVKPSSMLITHGALFQKAFLYEKEIEWLNRIELDVFS